MYRELDFGTEIIALNIIDNTISFFTNIENGCDVLSIDNPKVTFNNTQSPERINLYTTFEPQHTTITDNTIAVGNPSVEFINNNMGEVFVLIDEDGILSTIRYFEDINAASAVDYIDFGIPESSDFEFSQNIFDLDAINVQSSVNNLLTSISTLNPKTLRLTIDGPILLEGGDEVLLSNVKIIFNDSEVSKTPLEINVNSLNYSDDQDFDVLWDMMQL